eukprot:SAG31_NODE_3677_length_3996_cov_5.686939_3_plen_451_part_00
MMDPYPVVSISNDNQINQPRIAEMILGATRSLAATMKPYFIVLQSFGGGESWQRAPTGAEMRMMAFLALIHGASGVQYFARSPADVFPVSPSSWNEVRRVALEVAELTPALAGTASKHLPTLTANSSWIEVAAWDATTEPGAPFTTIAAVNMNNTPSAVTMNGVRTRDGGLYSGIAEVIDQNRNISVVAGELHDVLLGYGTVAYRFPPTSWSAGGAVTARNGILNPSYEYAANIGSPDGDYLKGPVDQLDGASFSSDPRTSVDGAHSLRLVNPTGGTGGGFAGGPYPSSLRKGTNYSLSVFAKAETPGVILDLRPQGLQLPQGANSAFNLTTVWAKYEVQGVAAADTKASVSSYTLTTPGVAWLDMLDVHQVNDCPTNADATSGFFDLQLPPFGASRVPTAAPLNRNASACCEAGWTAGVNFQQICEASNASGWFWWYPNTGPYLCCKSE